MRNNTAWILILMVQNVLSETARQMPYQGFRYAFYEVTIPRKLTPRFAEEPQNISYLLQIGGKGHIVHLEQKRDYISKHFPVFTYGKKGDLHVDYPFINNGCFYNGFIQTTPHSSVTLSTCSGGLRGLLQLANEIYEIEPVQGSATFQHVVYRLEEKGGASHLRCGLTGKEPKHEVIMMEKIKKGEMESRSKRFWWTHIRYVKIAIVVDYELYGKFGKNETLVAMHVMDVFHIANSFYDSLDVQLSIAGLVIWSEKNLIQISDSIEDTLNSFTSWRQDSLLKHIENDVGHLFVYKDFANSDGLAYMGGVCNDQYGSAVESYVTSYLFDFSVLFAHQLGHNLGMLHDKKYCVCDRKACIMSGFLVPTDKFSNCSYVEYVNQKNSHCLLIPPDLEKIYKPKYCGNKIVEKGEQCDCGSKALCESDSCCQSDCTLKSNAKCAFGQCCFKCEYLPAQTVCRQKTGICDLPEYCNGTSEWCPEDVYVQDGAPCKDGAHCYHGVCTTHSEQCKNIFGQKATSTSEDCFRKMNTRVDRFGNCGLKHGIYKKCDLDNILCGRIQCENVDSIPSLAEHSTIIQTIVGNKQCWSIDYHSGMKIADIGAVRDGTPCGKDRLCINRVCVNVSLLKYDCNSTKCHNRGICNTYKHCHCDYGWAPPDCINKGFGGSIDSGPPPPKKVITGTIIGIIFALCVALVCIGFSAYYRNELWHIFKTLSSKIHPTEPTKKKAHHKFRNRIKH
uniref:Disintegrin and metalloproteinase domain-containing protein 21-like n=1 Tax=Pogona vitticeps TaxID=103695 RepID=A0A6J0T684_9SAUR